MTPVEQIKEKLDIVKFISSYIEVKPAGKNFKARCPFHGEKTASFMISPDRQTWHCFGSCAEGGDIFKFLMKYENIEFYEALKILAEKAGVELKKISPSDQKQFGVLYDINESAKNFFKKELERNHKAKEYLLKRGLKQEIIDEFEIGASPYSFDDLSIYLVNLGFDIKDIERAGLNFKSDKGNYIDRFRHRIMFPIANHVGKVVSFSGRILPEYDNGETGKYINSPETPIFNKSKVLYGYNKSKSAIRQENSALLVEGQMDFLMLYQDGVKNVTASSGTALTSDHLTSLKRQTENIIFLFDSDEAGLKAAERSIDLADALDFNVRLLVLKDFKDPAEAVEKNPGKIKELIKNSLPAMEFYFERFLPKDIKATDISELKKLVRQILTKIKKLSSPLERDHWLNELSGKTRIEITVLKKEMDQLTDLPPVSIKEKIEEQDQPLKSQNIAPTRRELIADRLLKIAINKENLHQKMKECSEFLPQNFCIAYKHIIEKEPLNSPHLKSAIDMFLLQASLEADKLDDDKAYKEFHDLLIELKSEYYKERLIELKHLIKETEKGSDMELLSKYLKEFDEISKLRHTK